MLAVVVLSGRVSNRSVLFQVRYSTAWEKQALHMWKGRVSGNTCWGEVLSCVSPVKGLSAKRDIQGKVPHCSPFPTAASFPWEHASCHSFYDFVGWGKMLNPQIVAAGKRKTLKTPWNTNNSKCIGKTSSQLRKSWHASLALEFSSESMRMSRCICENKKIPRHVPWHFDLVTQHGFCQLSFPVCLLTICFEITCRCV